MFSKLFKPRWQHANAQGRLKAVEQLSSTSTDEHNILMQLAKGDSDSSVRCAAANAIIDIDFLLSLYKNDSDIAVKNAAAERLSHLLSHLADLSIDNRLRHLRLINDQNLLKLTLPHCTDAQMIDAILVNLSDEQALFDYALNGSKAEQRFTAAQRITQPKLLRQLARDGRDKKVVQLARAFVKEQQENERQEQEHKQALVNLIAELKRLASLPMDSLNGAKLQQLQDSYSPLKTTATDKQKQEIDYLFAENKQHYVDWQTKQQKEADLATQQSLQQKLLADYAVQLKQLEAPLWDEAFESLSMQLFELGQSWQQSTQQAAASSAQQNQFSQLETHWQQVLSLITDLKNLLQQKQAGTADNELIASLAQIKQQWPTKVAWPSFADELNTLVPAPKQKISKGKKTALHAGLLHQLRKSLNSRNLLWANRNWQRLMHALEEAPDALSANQVDSLKPQLDELRDWHAFAATPKKEQLCERMEALAREPLSHPEEQANAVHALHDEWQQLMSSNQDADQTHWERFKTASDAAYESCKQHFAELDKQREANLIKRSNICKQLADFIESEAFYESKAQAIWAIRQQAPKDWKAASPVRFTDIKPLQQEFNQLIKTLDEHLNTLSSKHLAELQTLFQQIEQASQLEPIQAAAEQIKKLQQQWKKIGWVYPRDYRKLDQQRHKLCNAVFDKLGDEQKAADQENKAKADALNAALTELSALLANNAPSSDIAAAQQQIAQLEEPLRSAPLLKQKASLIKQAQQRLKQIEAQAFWAQWQDIISQAAALDKPTEELLTLCVALEASAGTESPDYAQQARLAWQVSVLEKAMKGGSKSAAEQASELLEEHNALINQGLDPASRGRLLGVINHLSTSHE